jgi:hypothetical protein
VFLGEYQIFKEVEKQTSQIAVELTFTALEWSDAISVCAKIKKLAARDACGQSVSSVCRRGTELVD